MIPKKIHYCWFGGGPLPELAKKCIESWKTFCPDYEIIEWNEGNYDIHKNAYMEQAYVHKKWSFVSDYARLDIVYEHGGIYLDTDVEIIKSLDDLLVLDAFAGVEQDSEYVNSGLGFGACPKDSTIKAIRDYYDTISFVRNGQLDMTPAPRVNNVVLKQLGYHYSKEINQCCSLTIFPSDYFCPLNFGTNELTITDNTYSIHHYSASWYNEMQHYALTLRRRYRKIMPGRIASICATAVALTKHEGPLSCLKWIFKKRK